MQHLLNLNEQERDAVINNLLMMGGSTSTPQINAIGLNFDPSTPLHDVSFQHDNAQRSEGLQPASPPFRADIASLSLTDSPPPRPPRSPRRPCSPRISPPSLPIVVEDDNASGGGVKTSAPLSVLDFAEPVDMSLRQTTLITPRESLTPTLAPYKTPRMTSPPRPSRGPLRDYQPIFLANAFERPRDPDEVTPRTPPRPSTSRSAGGNRREDTRNTTQSGTNPGNTRDPNLEKRRPHRTLYATNNDIHRWLQQIIHNPPPRPQYRPPPPLGNITEERTDTDPELCEYRYDRTYDHAGEGQND
ncbi:hypothetical protein EDB86DRAFT_2831458 [Lactarius hatsudake]|nr:hypothetical protein EDB86DRAFT_2831458 [Lactarius hatsudake]